MTWNLLLPTLLRGNASQRRCASRLARGAIVSAWDGTQSVPDFHAHGNCEHEKACRARCAARQETGRFSKNMRALLRVINADPDREHRARRLPVGTPAGLRR
jgi:hypothetical protein